MQKILHIDNRKNIFFIASGVIGLCVCMYIYFVTATIRNIVTEKKISSQISDMSQKISSKEFESIAMSSKITLEYAKSLGFAEAQKKTFITPTSVSVITSNPSNNSTI